MWTGQCTYIFDFDIVYIWNRSTNSKTNIFFFHSRKKCNVAMNTITLDIAVLTFVPLQMTFQVKIS
jgi:hypothetical protein